ncbi:MAG: cytochrome c3 family protein [Phycisphaerae bacterium]|nr:cytochrome c3 family protein [Phycisphaerae bacterium]
MFKRPRRLIVGLAVLTVILTTISCDPVEKQKWLTFFFDGVPPIGGEPQMPEESSLEINSSDEELVRRGTEIRKVLFEHEPAKDCRTCHGQDSMKNFSLNVKLVKPVPELCFQCHEEYSRLSGWVHGPVAVGECLICHNPHRSSAEHLLQEPQPKLCYICHEQQIIESMLVHAAEPNSVCTDCHEAHASPRRGLMKTDIMDSIN